MRDECSQTANENGEVRDQFKNFSTMNDYAGQLFDYSNTRAIPTATLLTLLALCGYRGKKKNHK